MRRVEVVPHDPRWRDAFEAEAKHSAAALGENVVAIHHIGSTAIPNIYAKPVVDLLVEVRDIAEVDGRSSAMESLGYEVMGEYGIPGRRYFRKDAPDGVRTHQLHAFAAGAPEIRRHLDFRDYLRALPAEAAAYAALKQDLAARCRGDMRAYGDGKTAFIRAVERRAAVWRQRSRIAPASD